MADVDAAIEPSYPFTNRRVLNLQEVRKTRRPHIEPCIGRAEQEAQLTRAQVGMPEGRRVAIELFPVRFSQERLELLEHRRSGIRSQDLELGKRRPQLGGIVNCSGDGVPVVLEEAEDVKCRR